MNIKIYFSSRVNSKDRELRYLDGMWGIIIILVCQASKKILIYLRKSRKHNKYFFKKIDIILYIDRRFRRKG